MDLNDEQLAAAASRGDKAAMEVLIYRYHDSIYRYIYRLTASESAAQDLAQETFLHAIQALHNGRPPRSFRPWLYSIASNLCRDMWRSGHYLHEKACDMSDMDVPCDSDGGIVDLLERQQLRMRVIEAVTSLPMDVRQPVVLHFYEDMKVKDIAAVMDIPEGTVKSRLHRAYKLLKGRLSNDEGSADDERA
ncbi:RNA polymerase sigma factor [Mahella australiensis]|uniref:RNA polymerase sigma factor n=1 Tax=Mahella australiensis (strain DSM 15567 / CIP 107919 / 50-1 BON) TaxID=697281 RepID=F3ZYK9_MAHA5|nr:RNA polymerase sigma factor [Mahella australiensis]AEE97777.1 RNA polymerase, sigma-24 subunit, ECF subfamily [Mahella australiensis 50-1 BON]